MIYLTDFFGIGGAPRQTTNHGGRKPGRGASQRFDSQAAMFDRCYFRWEEV